MISLKQFGRLAGGAMACISVLWLAIASASAPAGVDSAALLADEPAPTLDAYHLFSDAGGRVANAGVTPYALNTPLFSDYAEKFRYVFLPAGTKARYCAEGVLDFPIGTALVKVFAYPSDFRKPDRNLRYIETRLLIHKPAGWVALTYVWNDAQDQATLKRAGGRTDVVFTDVKGASQHIDYHIPNVNQCKECHSLSNALTPIGRRRAI